MARREKFINQWIAWMIILALLIYWIITIALWLIIITASILLLFLTYQLSSIVEQLWIKILVWIMFIWVILFWWSEVLANYWKINQSIWNYSIEKAQDFKLLKSKKWNIKVESDYWTLIETKK